jgi:hypothetical protein
MVQRQASMLSFVEAFWVMGVLFLIMLPFIFLLRNMQERPPTPLGLAGKERMSESRPESPDEEIASVEV